jgi:hypothetical protein
MKTSIPMIKYLGGHPDRAKPTLATVTFNDDGMKANVNFRDFMRFEWDEITGVAIEGPDQVQKRVTATRLLTTGIFAFALKKKSKEAFLTVTTTRGEAIFHSEKLTPHEMRAKIGWVVAKVGEPTPSSEDATPPAVSAAPVSTADELKKLAELRDAGVLSDEEFDAQKAKLLG